MTFIYKFLLRISFNEKKFTKLSTIEVLRKIEHFKGMKDSELDEILEKCTMICQH